MDHHEQPTPCPESDPPATAESDTVERVYTLGELIRTKELARLQGTFSRLCGTEVVICNPAGKRIDVPTNKTSAGHDPNLVCNGMSVPVLWKAHVLGHVVVLDPERCTHATELAGLLADVLSALCHAQGYIRKRVSELAAVYDLGALFASSKNLDEMLNITAKRICDVMGVKAASIRLLDEATGTLVISGEHNLSERYLRKGPVTLRDNPIDAAAIAGEIVYIEDARTDPRVRFPEHARREGVVSGLCSPMSYRGYTVGVLRIYSGRKQRFSDFDVELSRAVASQAAAAIVHSRLFKEALAAAAQERQLKRGGQIQRRMVLRQAPPHPRITFGQVYEPSLEMVGDFFDYLDLPEGSIGVAIADVVGKGLPGALMMASVRSSLRAHAHSIFDINEIIAQVNREMCRDTQPSEFATLCYGVFAPDGTQFTYCNAGHNPPLLLRGQTFIPLETGGFLIGVLPDVSYDKDVVDLQSRDILVFYTDGVTEAFSFDDEMYGLDRFKESILRYRDEAAHTLANQLLWDVRRFVGLARQSDDISLVVAKVT